MNLREVILGLLIEQPMHAYALKRVLGPRLSPTELINDGVLYPLLTKMAAQGLISGATETGPSNKARTVYRATETGRQGFQTWLRTSQDESDEPTYDFFMGHPFLVKMQFFKHLTKKQRQAKLQIQVDRTKAKLLQFDAILAGMRERNVDPFRIGLLELGAAHQLQTLEWLQRWLD